MPLNHTPDMSMNHTPGILGSFECLKFMPSPDILLGILGNPEAI